MWETDDNLPKLIIIFMTIVAIIVACWFFGAFDSEMSKMASIKTPEGEVEIIEVEDYWIKNGIISVESTDGKTYIVPVEDAVIE